MQQQITHTYTQTEAAIRDDPTSWRLKNPQNVQSDEAAAATNQSVQKAVLGATRL